MRYGVANGVALAVLACVALLDGGSGTNDPSSQDAYKLAKVRETAMELASRDTSHLTPAQRAKRTEMIEALRAYADRGRFAQNDTYPGLAIPELVDRYGNRCALGNLLHVSGHDALLDRLARDHNHDFIRSLLNDQEFTAWVREHGLTLDEATYIMGPGYVDPFVMVSDDDTPTAPVFDEPGDSVPPGLREPRDPEPEDPTDGGDPGPVTTPDPDPQPALPEQPTTPSAGGDETGPRSPLPPEGTPTTPRGRQPNSGFPRRGRTATNTWERWWSLNRHAFVNLRERYHAQRNITPRDATVDDRRPSEAEIDAGIIPFLKKIAARPNTQTRATALAAWARAARPRHGSDLGKALRAYLGDGNNAYRQLILMKFGTVRSIKTRAALRQIVFNSEEGRKLLGAKGSIPESMRAFAAIGLGHTGETAAVDDLMRVLANSKKAMPDLRAACILAMGVLGQTGDEAQKGRVTRFLIERLRERRWPDQALAMIPAALAATGDQRVVPELQSILSRFRKPRVVRQSCALAIAALAPRLTEPLIDTLVGNARRDTDPTARRFALVAIGQVADRHPRGGDAKRDAVLADKLDAFYEGCFRGLNIQKQDMPWVYLSAALYGRRFESRSSKLAKRLLGELDGARSVERRCASIVALGVLGNGRAIKPIRATLAEAKDRRTKAAAAESLGLLGDRRSREPLRVLATTSPSDRVRYGAAIGLGFLADAGSLDLLLETFKKTGSHAAQATLARVLGEIGDRRAISPLIKLASDDRRDHWTRRRALAALGMIGQPENEATVTRYQKGVNYEQATASLQVVLNLF